MTDETRDRLMIIVATAAALAFIIIGLFSCATLKREGAQAALCAVPTPETFAAAQSCSDDTCEALVLVSNWLTCELRAHLCVEHPPPDAGTDPKCAMAGRAKVVTQ